MAQKIKDFSLLNIKGDPSEFWEQRRQNDANGNALYIGYSYKPNASTSEGVWYIYKQTFDGNNALTRRQLPDSGAKFAYVWNDRATLFS